MPGSQPSPCFHYKLLYPPSVVTETSQVLPRHPCPVTLAMPPELEEQRVCREGSPQCRAMHRNTPCPQGHPTAGLQEGLSAACLLSTGGSAPAGAMQCWGLACCGVHSWGPSRLSVCLRRNRAQKCSCYTVLLFSAAGSSV